MRAVVVFPSLVLVAACGHLPPPDGEGSDAATSPPDTSTTADGGTPADAAGGSNVDSGVQQCAAAMSAACQCEEGRTCTIDCGTQHPVSCLTGSNCTVTGAQCAVTCAGADTVCHVGGCTLCNCIESGGGACVK